MLPNENPLKRCFLETRRFLGLAWLNAVQPLFGERSARAALSRMAATHKVRSGTRPQLLVDVSVIAKSDARTGIQRVVRALLLQLIQTPPAGFEVLPVEGSGWRKYRYASAFHARVSGNPDCLKRSPELSVGAGDAFLGLDLATHSLIGNYRQLNRWRADGLRYFFVVHDLLPALHPEWFSAKAVRAYLGWIRLLAIHADGAFCVSRSVRDDLARWLEGRLGNAAGSLSLGWFHLGGNIQASAPSVGKPAGFDALLGRLGARPSILMAGTIEPRKGHAQALSAFELLWSQGREVNLVIVGKAGWRVDALVDRLRTHPESGRRLIWLEDASDEMLCGIYQTAAGVLMASEGEGFGLPIVEAAQYEKPILARKLPVFREIAGEHASYFDGDTPEVISDQLAAWLDLLQAGEAVSSAGIKRLTWEESARRLLENLSLALANGKSANAPQHAAAPAEAKP